MPSRKRCSPSWARLNAKDYQVDPLLCARCGKRMSIAFVTDAFAIRRVLDQLGPSTPEAERPPPPFREVLRVGEQDEGWDVPAPWE